MDIAGVELPRRVSSVLRHLFQVILMDSLDAAAFIELDPPTTRRTSSDNKTLATAIFWMARAASCIHLDAVTRPKHSLRF